MTLSKIERKAEDRGFYQGFARALADMSRYEEPTIVSEIVRKAGVKIKHLKRAGVAAHDLREIQKCLRD
jgi:hypothetical protein